MSSPRSLRWTSANAWAVAGLLGIALPVGLVGCKQPESTKLDVQPPPHVRPAQVRMVSPRPQSRHLVLVEPARRARLAPRIGGLLVELTHREQDTVEAGAVLAKLASGDSTGGLVVAQASIDRIGEAIRDNENELATARALAAKGIESARGVERLVTNAASLQAQLREAKGQRLRARDAVDANTIDAPFAGTITKIETEVGEYLAPSSAAIVLVALDPIAMEVPLTEREVALHDSGGLTFSATIRGQTRTPRLEWIAREADAGTSTFRARLLIDNPDGTLRAGESAQVEVFGAASAAQTAVPMTAIRWAGDVAYVLRLVGSGGEATIERLDVIVGDDSDGLVAIQGTLRQGDRVVAAGPARLVDGDAVVVVDEPEPTLASR